ncbi:cadherin-like domain-containing protein [Mycolicibacterium komossense]|uniref:cadherin-like domain-containing protein n=1 Tax=Mycolicibacterium komossense TaxID=1779 RepID=UPI0021F29650|nr:cadherin-like domain-containing protein [Mycolicibacterium komossense]
MTAAPSTTIPTPAEPLLDPVTLVRVVVDSVVAQAAGILGYGPVSADNPIQPLLPLRTMIEDAFAAFRRATNVGSTNETPALDPKQLYEFVTGEVIGDLLPSDANGDPLTYLVVQGPTNGTLTVNANGTYYYKPNHDFAETGGTDTFVIVADDGRQGETVVPVNVSVAPTLGVTESFWFRNYTLAPLKFTGYAGTTGDLDSGPAVGTVILPGGEANWNVTWYLFSSGSITTQFATVGFGATPSNPGFVPAGIGSTYQVSFKTNSRDTECSSGAGGQCSVPNDRLAIALDKGNPVVTLNAADAAKIAAVLPGICYDGSQASCSYNAISEVEGFSPVRTIGTPVTNTTQTPTTYSIGIADQVGQSDSVGISVKLSGGALAKLASLINIEITANYGHQWTSQHTFTQTMTVPVAAGYTSWIEGSVPVWRVTGDFTVKIGNSTYQLNGATFDTPNPNAPGSYVIRTKPIGAVGDGVVVGSEQV